MFWILVAVTVAAGLSLLAISRWRAGRLRPVLEGAPGRVVGELEAGRFRITGRVVPIHTSASLIDGSSCVFIERAEYRLVGSAFVPLLREIEHSLVGHPFYVDDGTGLVLVDPRDASIDAATLEDDCLVAERRVRAGEQIELVAAFRAREVEQDGCPYRANGPAWEAVEDGCGPPQISYRTDPSMMQPMDDVTAFIRGAGAMLLILSAVFAALGVL